MALFHSVSAFCNAGFGLIGTEKEFSSLTGYAAQPVINLAIMLLIVMGGIGFLTWDDIRTNRWHLHKYRMQSKVILSTTAILLAVPAIAAAVSTFCRKEHTQFFGRRVDDDVVKNTATILLMFFGRVGGLTLIFAVLSGTYKKAAKLPKEKITVG